MGLGKALAEHLEEAFSDKVFSGWCLLPHADGEEFYEFEWSYWPHGFEATASRRPDGTFRREREYWAVLPGGFIGIRGHYDISRTEFEARCQRAVAMGVPWCVLIDQKTHLLSVFRIDEIEHVRSVESWSLRELPALRWKDSWLTGNIAPRDSA